MSDRLLGLDPADFGSTGLTLKMLIGIAFNEPELVLLRLVPTGRRGGHETLASWKMRAVVEVIHRNVPEVDLNAPLTLEGTAPVTDNHEQHDDDLHQLNEHHGELDTWTARLVYTMKTADVYVVDAAHFHLEPRLADVHDVLDDAIDERDLALGRRTLIAMTPFQGFPIGLEPTEIASIRVDLYGPDGKQVLPIAPGSLDHAGPVERDEKGQLK